MDVDWLHRYQNDPDVWRDVALKSRLPGGYDWRPWLKAVGGLRKTKSLPLWLFEAFQTLDNRLRDHSTDFRDHEGGYGVASCGYAKDGARVETHHMQRAGQESYGTVKSFYLGSEFSPYSDRTSLVITPGLFKVRLSPLSNEDDREWCVLQRRTEFFCLVEAMTRRLQST